MSRTRLYELRTAFLRDKTGYSPEPSGGDRRSPWPARVDSLLEVFLPLQDPPIHQWWRAPDKQILLLTVDDHSGRNVAGRFVWPPILGTFGL